MGRFKAREIRNDATLDEIRRQLNEIQKDLASDLSVALAARKVAELQLGDYAAGYGDVARFAPPSAGARLILPEPNPARLGDDSSRVTAVLEAATGALTVEVVNGTINGATTLAYAAGVGAAEFVLTKEGWYTWSATLGLLDIDSASIVYDATSRTLQRAALTGFAEATQNSNATTSAEPLVAYSASANMSAERVLTSSTSVTVSTATAGQIELRSAAKTGEVTASANVNIMTVTRATDFQASPWTGNHQFNGEVRLGTLHTDTNSGALNITLTAGASRILFSHATGNITLGTVSGAADGRVLVVEFTGTGTHTVTHSTAGTDAFSCPGTVDLVITGRGGFLAVARGTVWKVIATTN